MQILYLTRWLSAYKALFARRVLEATWLPSEASFSMHPRRLSHRMHAAVWMPNSLTELNRTDLARSPVRSNRKKLRL